MRYLPRVLLLAALAAPACDKSDPAPAAGSFATQSTGTSVSFELTPRAADAGRLAIALRANTHSGDLAEIDLAKAMRLHVGGESFAPVEAPSLSGHHDGGSVVFEPGSAPAHFDVTISGVRGMPELRLSW